MTRVLGTGVPKKGSGVKGTKMGFPMPSVSAPAVVMPLKSDAFGKKRVRPSEVNYALLHTLPKGD